MGNNISCPERASSTSNEKAKGQQLPSGKAGAHPHISPLDTGYWSTVGRFLWDGSPLMLANTMEWYEFAVYAAMEPWISEKFFQGSGTVTWLVFGLTFVVRPLGGFAFGLVADRLGRRPAVLGSLSVMCCATVGQGLTPTFASLGPAWLLTCRILQGLATGGEVGSVCVYFTESAPPSILGMACLPLMINGQLGFALSSFVGLVLLSLLSDAQMLAWGWRLPFLLAAGPGVLALFQAYAMEETEQFQDLQAEGKDKSHDSWQSKAAILRHYWPQGLLAFCGNAAALAQGYLAGSYLKDWLIQWCGMGKAQAFGLLMYGQTATILICLPAGALSDYFGLGRWNFMVQCIGTVLPVPMFAALYYFPNNYSVTMLAGILMPALLQGLCISLGSWTCSLFPTEVRCTSVSLYYNIASAIGGLAPVICSMSNDPLFVGYYCTIFGLISTIATGAALLLHADHQKTGEGLQVAYLSEENY